MSKYIKCYFAHHSIKVILENILKVTWRESSLFLLYCSWFYNKCYKAVVPNFLEPIDYRVKNLNSHGPYAVPPTLCILKIQLRAHSWFGLGWHKHITCTGPGGLQTCHKICLHLPWSELSWCTEMYQPMQARSSLCSGRGKELHNGQAWLMQKYRGQRRQEGGEVWVKNRRQVWEPSKSQLHSLDKEEQRASRGPSVEVAQIWVVALWLPPHYPG